MKSYTDRHWASVKWKNTVENVLAQFFNRVFLIWCGESHWRNRPKVYEYRGSMPICISSSTQGESQWGHRPKVYEYRGSMPICISSSTQGESQWGHRPSGLWVHGSMPLVSLWKKWKICRIIKKTLAFKILV